MRMFTKHGSTIEGPTTLRIHDALMQCQVCYPASVYDLLLICLTGKQ